MTERDQIIDICTRSPWYIDRQEWQRLAELYTDEVLVDYTSVNGGQPQTYRRADFVAGLASELGGLDATQHVSANHLVEISGDTANCTANVIGVHKRANRLGAPMRVVGGYYRFGLVRVDGTWKINSLAFTLSWADGNPAIMAAAAGRG